MSNLEKLVKLYQQMADLTLPKCKQCRVPLSCCSSEYCEIAKQFAKETYDITLHPTNHSKLPFMGKNGCIVSPYLRPNCTMHTCSINSIGCDIKDQRWTEKYYALRQEIEELEFDSHF